MLGVGCAQDHRVDLGVLQDTVVVVDEGDPLLLGEIPMAIGSAGGEADHLDLLAVLHRVDHVAAPPAESYHRSSDHCQPPFLLT